MRFFWRENLAAKERVFLLTEKRRIKKKEIKNTKSGRTRKMIYKKRGTNIRERESDKRKKKGKKEPEDGKRC